MEIKTLTFKVRGLVEDDAVGKAATVFFAGERGSAHPLIMGFIDTMRAGGHGAHVGLSGSAVSRAARSPHGLIDVGSMQAGGLLTELCLMLRLPVRCGIVGGPLMRVVGENCRPSLAYGRRKMTAYLRRTTMPEASAGSVWPGE